MTRFLDYNDLADDEEVPDDCGLRVPLMLADSAQRDVRVYFVRDALAVHNACACGSGFRCSG
jgi:hypothetical protein